MPINLNALETEQSNPNSRDIDTMDTIQILHVINHEDQQVAGAVETVLPKISELIDRIAPNMAEGGHVIYIGAGTSGRLGVLDASECPPTYGVDPNLIKGLIAGGYGALLTAKEGAEDDMDLAAKDLMNAGLTDKDTVIGLAASGRTPYVIGGLDYAHSIGALTGAISCVTNARISSHADVKIEAIVGPEVITGSTRMKAGTAQKMILNMISTSLMIQYGKVYHNLMVDVQPTNEKLIERAKQIIMESSGCCYQEADKYLEKSGSNVKLAICMTITHRSKEDCDIILRKAGGNISKAIHSLTAE
ncbi:MAG: N-acetylmuramic acid 6-phosphate etherase [Oscillospiraceae bacterium]|jgi:N-acetylmuramic acid 6-phosphate etherase|nr:N-acetylmuramic acid 6-phosphate etherase [Oscillospiraceae bacterium]